MSTGINHSIMSLHEDNSLLDSACPHKIISSCPGSWESISMVFMYNSNCLLLPYAQIHKHCYSGLKNLHGVI